MKDFPYRSFFSKLYEKSFDDHIFDSAAQVGFYFSFALFPLLLFLVALAGFFLDASSGYQSELYYYLRQILPLSGYELVKTTIEEVLENSSRSKIAIGIAVALWSGSAGIDSLRIALNRVYKFKEQRSWFLTKIVSVVLTFLLTMLIAVALSGVFYGWQFVSFLIGYLQIVQPEPYVLVFLQWVFTLVILLFIFEVLYNILPDRKPFRWNWITPGSLVAIGLWLTLSYGWKTYLQYFNYYDKVYGSIGAGIILMLWVYLTALAILIGGMINAILAELSESADDPEGASADAEMEESDVVNAS